MKNNNVIRLFHSTIPMDSNLNFDNFEFDFSKSLFGIHFGSEETALNRIPIKIAEMEKYFNGENINDFNTKKEHPVIITIDLICNNPFVLNENRTGQWSPYDVINSVMDCVSEMEDPFPFTDEEIDSYFDDDLHFDGISINDLIDMDDYCGETNDNEKLKLFVTNFLKSKGYDSIIYKNEFELGGDSYIAFDNKQIEIIDINFPNGEYTNKNKRKNKFI